MSTNEPTIILIISMNARFNILNLCLFRSCGRPQPGAVDDDDRRVDGDRTCHISRKQQQQPHYRWVGSGRRRRRRRGSVDASSDRKRQLLDGAAKIGATRGDYRCVSNFEVRLEGPEAVKDRKRRGQGRVEVGSITCCDGVEDGAWMVSMTNWYRVNY